MTPWFASRHARRSSQRGERVVGERLRAEGRVVGAADVVAAGHRDHVVEGRDPEAQAGERGRVGGVRVHDRVQLRTRRVDRGVEAPLGRRLAATRRAAVGADERDVVGLESVVGNAGRRHEEAGARSARAAHRHVAGLVDVDAARVHRARRGDDRFPQPAAVVAKSGHAACRRLGEERAEFARRDHAALGDDPGDEPGGRDVERRIGDRRVVARDAHRRAPLLRVEARALRAPRRRRAPRSGCPPGRRRWSSRSSATAPRRRRARRCRSRRAP